jgi:hypothetical protein
MTVARHLSNSLANEFAPDAVSRLATTSRAPATKGKYSSRPAMSKDNVVTANRTSSISIPGRTRIDSSRFVSEPCVTSTPLGRPVDPEV